MSVVRNLERSTNKRLYVKFNYQLTETNHHSIKF